VKTLIVSADTTAAKHDGRRRPLPAGKYKITEMHGTPERGIIHISHPRDGLRVSVFPHEPHIEVVEVADP
jgi:hypothetical protein